ncbi:MAG: hypothetical protein Q7T11_08045 [Deltaproteobacteria bacterium]|nr:hypothetical protein [Deltaproteobacteria bacterium]
MRNLAAQNSFFQISSSMDRFIRSLDAGSHSGIKKKFGEWKKILHQFKLFLARLPQEIRQNEMVIRFKMEMEIREKRIKMLAKNGSIQGIREEALRISESFASIRENIQKWLEAKKWLAGRHQFQWGRKFFHVANSLFGLWLYLFSGFSEAAVLGALGGYLGLNLTFEIARKVSPKFNARLCHTFSWMMRENERQKISSATWYLASIFLVMVIFPKEVVVLCVLFVAFGDTLAGLVGAHWGKHKIGLHGSLEGFLAGLAANAVSIWIFAAYFLPSLDLSGFPLIGFSGLAGLIGAVAEMTFKKWDDNLMIPLLSALPVLGLIKIF